MTFERTSDVEILVIKPREYSDVTWQSCAVEVVAEAMRVAKFLCADAMLLLLVNR